MSDLGRFLRGCRWGFVLLAILAAIPSRAPAQSNGETPEAFAGRIVELYGPKGVWWKLGDSKADDAKRNEIAAQLFEPHFNALIDENSDLAGKRGDADLDVDPLCQCQDGPDTLVIKSITPQGADSAELHMAGPDCGQGSSECDDYVIVIHRNEGQWRVADVTTKDEGSLRAMLERHNNCMRTVQDDAALAACWK